MKESRNMVADAVLAVLIAGAAAKAAAAAQCGACWFDCPEGTTNCWSCGTRVQGSQDPAKLVPGRLIVVGVLDEKRAGKTAAAAGAERERSQDVESVEKWIDANPDDFSGALQRLEPLLDAVRGTAHEARVEDRIARVRAAIEEASRPMTAAEREKRAASMVAKVAANVRRRDDRPAENVRELEQLLAVAKGTNYEEYVRQLLDAEKAKLNR